MPSRSLAAVKRAEAARTQRRLGPDHPDTRAAWRDAYAEQFAEAAERIATRAPRFSADQIERIAAILDAAHAGAHHRSASAS